MDAGCAGDLADDSVLVNIDNDDFGVMADVEAAPSVVNAQVIPATLAADVDFLDEIVLIGSAQAGQTQEGCQTNGQNDAPVKCFHTLGMMERGAVMCQPEIGRDANKVCYHGFFGLEKAGPRIGGEIGNRNCFDWSKLVHSPLKALPCVRKFI
jgi:hypothetical protein